MKTIGQSFHSFAKWTANKAGNPGTFAACLGLIIVWAATGPFLGFSDSWQLIINTGTTVVTFLMVFLIQNTQNRDTQELHLKIDELLRATKGARNTLLSLEELDDQQLQRLKSVYDRLGQKARQQTDER
jgi:low affinity Fe/Cu permease